MKILIDRTKEKDTDHRCENGSNDAQVKEEISWSTKNLTLSQVKYIWRPPSLSKLTPYHISKLTHLGSDTST